MPPPCPLLHHGEITSKNVVHQSSKERSVKHGQMGEREDISKDTALDIKVP